MESTCLRLIKVCFAENVGNGTACQKILDSLLADDRNQVPSLQKMAATVELQENFRKHTAEIMNVLKLGNSDDFKPLRKIPIPSLIGFAFVWIPVTTKTMCITYTEERFTVRCEEGLVLTVAAGPLKQHTIPRLIKAALDKNVELYKMDLVKGLGVSDFNSFWRTYFGSDPSPPQEVNVTGVRGGRWFLYNVIHTTTDKRTVWRKITWFEKTTTRIPMPPPNVDAGAFYRSLMLNSLDREEDSWLYSKIAGMRI